MTAAETKQPGQFIYKKPLQGGQQHPNPEFYLRVDPDAYNAFQKVAEIDEVLCSRSGSKPGLIERPSQQELLEHFGTTDFSEIVQFMLEHGKWHPYGPHDAIRNRNELARIK